MPEPASKQAALANLRTREHKKSGAKLAPLFYFSYAQEKRSIFIGQQTENE